jgi:Protein of unknown function (DUF2752)
VFELSPQLISAVDRRLRWGILGFSATPLTGAYFYSQGHHLSWLVCPVNHFTGIPCPTCGMTRSFVATIRGDWQQAFTYHLFAPLLFAGFTAAIVHVTIELITTRKLSAPYLKLLKQRRVQVSLLALFFAYYGFRLYHLVKNGDFYSL